MDTILPPGMTWQEYFASLRRRGKEQEEIHKAFKLLAAAKKLRDKNQKISVGALKNESLLDRPTIVRVFATFPELESDLGLVHSFPSFLRIISKAAEELKAVGASVTFEALAGKTSMGKAYIQNRICHRSQLRKNLGLPPKVFRSKEEFKAAANEAAEAIRRKKQHVTPKTLAAELARTTGTVYLWFKKYPELEEEIGVWFPGRR